MKYSLRALAFSSSVLCLGIPGAIRADTLAITHGDFSNAAQGTAGFQYGYYQEANATVGTFSTANMAPSGTKWLGSEPFSTPLHGAIETHPGGDTSALRPSVRRYTVGSGGEPAYSGMVRITGLFFRQGTGLTNRFITVNGSTIANQNNTAGDDRFDLSVNVTPGSTIDFGVAPGANPDFDTTGIIAWIGDSSAAIPTDVVANVFNSPTNDRGGCFALATNGVLGATDETTFDTTPGTGAPNQFAGLLYRENADSGKVTRFNSVRIDLTTAGDFTGTPRLYLLHQNSDTGSSNPAMDSRYVQLSVVPVRNAANTAGQPFYTFDLSGLSDAQRTGYGFAVVGAGTLQGTSIEVSEISAVAVRVAETPVTAPPYLMAWWPTADS